MAHDNDYNEDYDEDDFDEIDDENEEDEDIFPEEIDINLYYGRDQPHLCLQLLSKGIPPVLILDNIYYIDMLDAQALQISVLNRCKILGDKETADAYFKITQRILAAIFKVNIEDLNISVTEKTINNSSMMNEEDQELEQDEDDDTNNKERDINVIEKYLKGELNKNDDDTVD